MNTFRSYVAIGDSFTEGVGDEQPDGRVRGWADLVALGMAASSDSPITYANLAIRGRLLAPIVGDQLEAALTLKPALLSINGGGNDILRPRVAIDEVAKRTMVAVERAIAEGIYVVLASGANPSGHMPLGKLVRTRGGQLAEQIRERLPPTGVTFVDNWSDAELGTLRYWSLDRIHLNALGHARVASNVLSALDIPVPDSAANTPEGGEKRPGTAEYWRSYVFPWIGRRLTGRSSGDNREPKISTLQPVELPTEL